MDEIVIVPYTKIGDEWTIKDKALGYIWNKLVDEGTAKKVFNTGTIRCEDDFVRFMKSPNNTVMTEWIDNDIVFLGWVNNITNGSAFSHFICFKTIWGKRSRAAFRISLEYWFSFERDFGVPQHGGHIGYGKKMFNTLIGLISDNNKVAVNMVKKCGVKVLGTIPNYSHDVYMDEPIGVTVCYIQQGDINYE